MHSILRVYYSCICDYVYCVDPKVSPILCVIFRCLFFKYFFELCSCDFLASLLLCLTFSFIVCLYFFLNIKKNMEKYATALMDFADVIQQLKISKEAKVSEKQALEILKKQEICQIC